MKAHVEIPHGWRRLQRRIRVKIGDRLLLSLYSMEWILVDPYYLSKFPQVTTDIMAIRKIGHVHRSRRIE